MPLSKPPLVKRSPPMNPITTEIPKAQDAYMSTLKAWEEAGVDSTAVLLALAVKINACIAQGGLITSLDGIENVAVAEKAAIELRELGYDARTTSGSPVRGEDGSIRVTTGIVVNWVYSPSNTRDKWSV